MAKVKIENNFIWVMLAAIRIYSTNFIKFCGYMAFPVLGQVLGLLLTFCLAGIYTVYLPELAMKYPIFQDDLTVTICVTIITLPGMLIFIKAFWDYLIAYGAINSITDGYLSTGRIYDYPSHNATVTKNAIKFISIWFLYSLFWLIIINPLFWVIGAFLFIYFVLIFQVFSYESDKTPVECFKRSFQIIRGNGIRTLLIMVIIGLFTHVIFVQGFSVFFDFTRLTQFLSTLFEEYLVEYIPIDFINEKMLLLNPSFNFITSSKVAEFIVYQLVAFLVIGFTLPLRSVTWALWYKALSGNNEPAAEVKTRGKKKVLRKISQEVIDRARRKYED